MPQHIRKISRAGALALTAVTLEPPFAFESPFSGEFSALIIASEPPLLPEDQMRVSEQLISTGCRYAMGVGPDGSSWDASVDFAFIQSAPDGHPPENRFVMTTWHDDESDSEVASWLVWNTYFDYFEPKNFLVLAFKGSEERLERIYKFAEKFLQESGG